MAVALALVASLFGLNVLVGEIAGAIRGAGGGDGVRGASPNESLIVAEAGDTYWSIAKSIHPSGDIRETVDALVVANGGRPLRIGDRLVVAMGDRHRR